MMNLTKSFAILMLVVADFGVAESIQTLSAQCAACHGAQGITNAKQWPNLAGQKAGYLKSQIMAFRDGSRKEVTMLPFVKNLSNKQIAQLAEYFSSQTPKISSTKKEHLAGKNVRAYCISCHGKQGYTVNQQWPNLAGQNALYIIKQLTDYQTGARQNPVMEVIANELNSQQIKDVARYYSEL